MAMNLSRRRALGVIATTPALSPLAPALASEPRRTATDPDMLHPEIFVKGVLSVAQLGVIAALADVILPADDRSPSASALRCHEYVDEYVSAPYEENQQARTLIEEGIEWLQDASRRRFGRQFSGLTDEQKRMICDGIKWQETAEVSDELGARFFALVRDLVATAFFTTEEGMADIGYIGNVPSVHFAGPSQEILQRLGLEPQASDT
jgi:gluconate 2-dehydrogenase gamma chain